MLNCIVKLYISATTCMQSFARWQLCSREAT